jgi:hypothetical protein
MNLFFLGKGELKFLHPGLRVLGFARGALLLDQIPRETCCFATALSVLSLFVRQTALHIFTYTPFFGSGPADFGYFRFLSGAC